MWVQYIFEGTLLNETRLLTCETITSRDEMCVCVSCGFYIHIFCLHIWVQYIFEGTLTNETRCLTCETIASRHEVCVCALCVY